MSREILTVNEAALILSIVKKMSVDKSLTEMGIRPKKPGAGKAEMQERRKKMIELFRAGYSVAEIARKLNTYTTNVYYLLIHEGLWKKGAAKNIKEKEQC